MTQPCPGEYLGIAYTLPENDKYLYIADVEVEVADSYITPTPVRRQGRVFFPVGKWRGYLSSIDIELLQREGGRILKVHEVLLFRPFYDLANYAADIYTKRKNSTSDFEKIVYKLLLNSLYGKFAESATKSKLFLNPDNIPITWEEQQTMRMIQLFPGAWSQEVDIEVPHMHVPIATHITSFARRTIYDYLSMCREFHYCDTDGFSTTEILETGKELGDLKLEKMIREGHFVAPKLYRTDGQELVNGEWVDVKAYKGKGMSRLTAGRFMKLIEGGSIDFERMARVKERWRSGDLTPIETTVTKRIRLKSMFSPDFEVTDSIPKRYTNPDGSTRAWQLDELEGHLGKEEPYKKPVNKEREERMYRANSEKYPVLG